MKRCVTGSNAATSEAIKYSPIPIPITKGLPFLHATKVLGSVKLIIPSAYAPSNLVMVCLTAVNKLSVDSNA